MADILSNDHFAGKHVFIAGGTSGINLGIAERFAEVGAKVAVCSRDAAKVDAAVKTLKNYGGEAMGQAADVRDFEQVQAALMAAHGAFGPIDVLISGAAGNFVSPGNALSPNGFKVVVDIDLNGTFHVFRAGYDLLTRPGASVIAISAPQAVHPYMYQSHVCAAKAGVDMLVRTLAAEWGPDGIRVNSIIPGPIEDTEGMDRLAPTPEAKQMVIDGTPLRRYGRKSEIGDAALFLSSALAGYITGVNLPVDGGAVLMGASRMGEAIESAWAQAQKARAK
jgi:NAD(P)-dependent dehydrogenase (short-subunit alcohol dehydrogenase family)